MLASLGATGNNDQTPPFSLLAAPKVGKTDANPSWLSTLGAGLRDIGTSLNGGTPTALDGIQAARTAANQASLQRQQAYQLAQQLYPDDPKSQLAFAADPKGGLAAFYKAAEPATLSEGQVRFGPGGKVLNQVAKTGFQNDRPVSTNPVTGSVAIGDALPMGYAEQTAAAAQAEKAAQDLAEQGHWQQQNATEQRGQNMTHQVGMANVGVAQRNLGLRGQEFDYTKFHDLVKDHPDAVILQNPAIDYPKLPSGVKYIVPGQTMPRTKP